MRNKATKISVLILVLIVSFFGFIFYQNITTFNGIQNNTAYQLGIIIQSWEDVNGGNITYYSRYEYSVNGITYIGKQGIKTNIGDTYIIVYDFQYPQFSMISDYSESYQLRNGKLIIDTSRVQFDWIDYLPGDKIESLSDLFF
jgi:hypothetical protein